MQPHLSDAPELAEIRLELTYHQRVAHAVACEVCDVCRWLHRLEEDRIEADLARFEAAA